MALNPTWFNNLVDDTGTGTTGTVWNKAAINGLLANINAEIARLDGKDASGVWYPTLTTNLGGAAAYAVQSGTYARSDKSVTISCRLACGVGSLVAGGVLLLGGLPFPSSAQNGQNHGGIVFPLFSGLANPVSGLGSQILPNSSNFQLLYLPAGGSTAMTYLIPAFVGSGFDIYGMGSYICQ